MLAKLIGYQNISSTNKDTGELREFRKFYFTRPAGAADRSCVGDVVLDLFLSGEKADSLFSPAKIGATYELQWEPNYRGQAELASASLIGG